MALLTFNFLSEFAFWSVIFYLACLEVNTKNILVNDHILVDEW